MKHREDMPRCKDCRYSVPYPEGKSYLAHPNVMYADQIYCKAYFDTYKENSVRCSVRFRPKPIIPPHLHLTYKTCTK